MDVIAKFVKVSLPNYLKSLPIPRTFAGFGKLTGSDWITLLPFVGTVTIIFYLTISALFASSPPKPKKDDRVNRKIQKDVDKVVTVAEIEELGDKTCYCRCWKSKKFPLCDGTHNKHNEEFNDNVGPVVIVRKKQ